MAYQLNDINYSQLIETKENDENALILKNKHILRSLKK